MSRLYNLARMSTTTTGSGTVTLLSAVTGCLSFDNAGVQNGDTISYGITDGNNSEVGRGVYTASASSLSRSVLKSTNAGNPLSLSGSAQVFITALAEDIGNVLGNASVTDGHLAVFDGDGYHIKDGGALPSASGLVLVASWVWDTDVTSLDIALAAQLAALYPALQILMHIRTDRAGDAREGIRLRFSTGGSFDTGGNYRNRAEETGSAAYTQTSSVETCLWIGRYDFPASAADAGVYGYGELKVMGWADAVSFTNILGLSNVWASSTVYVTNRFWGHWKNTGVVDGLRFYTHNGTNIITGSWIKVYGYLG